MMRQKETRTTRAPRHWALGALALGLLLAANGCAQKKDDPQGPLAIIGTYTDSFGGTQTVTQTTWSDNFGDVWHIAEYANFGEFLIAQNDHANSFAADLWSRFDWVTYQGHLYYCQTAFAAATLADAENTPRSGDTNPTASTACGDAFSWTQLN